MAVIFIDPCQLDSQIENKVLQLVCTFLYAAVAFAGNAEVVLVTRRPIQVTGTTAAHTFASSFKYKDCNAVDSPVKVQ